MRRAWILMLASFVAGGSIAGCLLTSSFDGLTGGKVLPDGGTGTGGAATTSSSSAGGAGGAATTSSSSSSSTASTSTSSSATASSSSATASSSSATASSSSSAGGDAGPPFPTTSVLDTFERPDGALGGMWIPQIPGAYTIANHQLSVPTGSPGSLIWPTVFGPTQEAFITIVTIDPSNFEFELLLKNQSGVTECEAMEVVYHYPTFGLFTCTGGNAAQIGSYVTDVLVPGDRFGARAYPDGTVEAYKNGTLVITWDASSFPAHASGGRIGFETDSITKSVRFDDFGGG